MTFRGSCHCGAIRFELTSTPITEGIRCNCSLCDRRGVVMSARYFTPKEIRVEGKERATTYRWGDRLVNHWFCTTCGVYTFHDTTAKPGHFRVNLGCLEGIDPRGLRIAITDGRAF
jgi:hypothetical protein